MRERKTGHVVLELLLWAPWSLHHELITKVLVALSGGQSPLSQPS